MHTNSENPDVGKSFQELACKSLAEYFVRLYGHLLRDVKVFEVDEHGRINVIRE